MRAWRWLKRGVAACLGLVLVLALAVAAAGWATLPPRHGSGQVPGLGAQVQVTLDEDGVPRVQARSDLDAAVALGYLHARDRMFQMDLMRRVGSGRLAEAIGASGLRYDTLMRTLGLRRRAEADLLLLPPHTRALLDAYSRGVNAWIAARGRWAGPEFVLLGAPAPWTPTDCLLWGKTMSLYLSGNYRAELARMALGRRIRPDLVRAVWPAPPVPLPPTAALDAGPARLARLLVDGLPRFPQPFTLPGTASNEWAVSGAHSATGAPLLAGDPHLSFGLPGLWYLARLDWPGGVLAGATSPGTPFLVIGRNARIAWTFTTTGSDTQDVFIETPLDATHYQSPSGPLAFATHTETIHVRFGADVVIQVRETRHGPVISDLPAMAQSGQVLAVQMAGLAPGDTAAAGLDRLDRARDVAEAMAAAPAITSPNQNLLVADARHIGLAVTGRVPIRASGNGLDAVDGQSGDYDWTGFASGTALPHFMDPPSGRLVNANEPLAGPDFPVKLGAEWFGDWRARRIRTLLDAHPHAKIADFTAMQADSVSTFAADVLPTLRTIAPPTPLAARALWLLAGWQGDMRADQPQPLIFNAWMQRFALALLDRGGIPVSLSGPRLEFIGAVLGGTVPAAYGEDGCAALLATALGQATADLAATQGGDPARWRWGALHRAVFAHPVLANLPLLGSLGRARIDAPGDDATLDRGGMAESNVPDFTDRHGASYRGVYDLADLDRSRFIVAPGQSGNLFSAHLANFMARWRDGQTITLGPTAPHIGATLTLLPEATATDHGGSG